MTEASRRSLRWIIPSAIALIVVAVGTVGFINLKPEAPAKVATDFWNDLAAGKAQQALSLTSTPAPANGLLLTDDVYEKADRGIAGVTAHGFSTAGGAASGTIDYTLHGKQQSAQVKLTKVRHGLLQPSTWQITNAPLAAVHATVSSDGSANALSVNGTSLPLPGDGTLVIPALPGTYSFSLGSSTKLLTSQPQSVAVTGSTANVTLKLNPSAQLGQQAIAQTESTLNGCFSNPALTASCPVTDGIRSLFDLTADTGLTYHLTRAPKLSFDATTMQVTSNPDVRADDGEVMASTLDPKWGQINNVSDFSLAFDVTVKSGKLTVTPDQGGINLTVNKVTHID
ncbi:hypothetical protein ACFOYW_11745 [Gryllotalpicola reticulitermitis]|uniref:DUF2993 domain-containing protein n=1 Tax=Gryllotalpicola reticulitermitis TaxID=1184153 RepID=A0ABV8Q8U7_9MICO